MLMYQNPWINKSTAAFMKNVNCCSDDEMDGDNGNPPSDSEVNQTNEDKKEVIWSLLIV